MGTKSLSVNAVQAACLAAEQALADEAGLERALGFALDRLRHHLGPDVLCSVFLHEHGRVWVLAQRGYRTLPDGQPLSQGITSRAVRTGQPQFVGDVRADEDYVAADEDVCSELALPLGEGVPAAGVLDISTRARSLPRAAVEHFAGLARLLGARLEAEETAPQRGLSALARLFVHVSLVREVDTIAELTARSLGHLLQLDSTQLYLGEREAMARVGFWVRAESGLQPLDSMVALRLSERVTTTAAFTSLPVDADLLQVSPDRGTGEIIWLPLRASGNMVGAVVGYLQQRRVFEREQREAAALLAAHAAAALDSARALERERRAAVTDPLTGLLNRRGFDDHFEAELERAQQTGQQVSILMLDCDDFKTINDRGGHDRGDRALRAIAACLEDLKRPGDITARLGGDEFAVVLAEAGSTTAQAVAERLREGLLAAGGPRIGITSASFGTATYPADGFSPAELLRAADQAMYAAKRSGKNRTVTHRQLRGRAAGWGPPPESGHQQLGKALASGPRTEVALSRETTFRQLLQEVAVIANEATDSQEALQTCLELVCVSTGWPLAHISVFEDDSDALASTSSWHPPADAAAFAALIRGRQEVQPRAGVGPLGRVLATGEPVWMQDIGQEIPSLATVYRTGLGVRGTCAVPVLVGRDIVAVLELFASWPWERDEAMLEVLACVGVQLGRVVERERAWVALSGAGGGQRRRRMSITASSA